MDGLLCFTRDTILRLEYETKEVIKQYPFKHLLRWAASPETFTMDFGAYEEDYVVVVTTEGEAISNLIAGYIDLMLKKQRGTGGCCCTSVMYSMLTYLSSPSCLLSLSSLAYRHWCCHWGWRCRGRWGFPSCPPWWCCNHKHNYQQRVWLYHLLRSGRQWLQQRCQGYWEDD